MDDENGLVEKSTRLFIGGPFDLQWRLATMPRVITADIDIINGWPCSRWAEYIFDRHQGVYFFQGFSEWQMM